MQRLAGFFHAVVSAGGLQVVVPEVPDQRGPRVVEHPLDHAGRAVLVARIGLEHGALGIVGHGLRLALVIGEVGGRAVDRLHRVFEMTEDSEIARSRRDSSTRDRRERCAPRAAFFAGSKTAGRPRPADFRSEAVRAAKFRRVREPVIRRRVIVRAAHFHAGAAGERRDVFRCGRKNRIRPVELLEHGEKRTLDDRGRRLVAAVEPREHAGMRSQARDLRALGSRGDFDVALLPIRPFLPVVAAGPSGHDQNSLLIGKIEECVRLRGAFEADGVEIQVAKVGELRFQALGRFAQEHVRRPPAATDQDALSVHAKQKMALRVNLGRDFADAVTGGCMVRDDAADRHVEVKMMQGRRAHLMRPPQLGVLDAKFGEIFGPEADSARFAGGERYVLRNVVAFEVG